MIMAGSLGDGVRDEKPFGGALDGVTQMPSDEKLAASVIADFETWVARGAA